jgi:hypothetical protein
MSPIGPMGALFTVLGRATPVARERAPTGGGSCGMQARERIILKKTEIMAIMVIIG